MSIKHAIKMFYFKKIKKYDEAYIRRLHLEKLGMTIGEQTYIFSDGVETSESYLVTLGSNVMVAPDVRFTTHDASASFYIPEASDIFGRINIGYNCFIGMCAIILPGVTIAEHSIVGAGSVVTKSFLEPYSVIAGNPAKKICAVEQLKEKNMQFALNTWHKSYTEKKEYLLANQDRFKG